MAAKLSLRQIVRWVRGNLISCGLELEQIDIVEGFDAVLCGLRCGTPRMCALEDFYEGIFPREDESHKRPLEAGLKKQSGKQIYGDNIQSAEQLIMLANAGLANDKREQK
jgi:hypothetical protein